MENMFLGIQSLATPEGILALIVGCAVGFIVGVLPGIGQGMALILLLPFGFFLPANIAFILLAASLGSAAVGGSVTSIILNTPGSAANLTTLLDGYPMAKRGEAGRALGLAAMSSIIGGVFGIFVLVAMIPVVRPLIYLYGAAEFFWTIVLALVIVALSTAGGAFLNGLISALIGLAASLIGFNWVTGGIRYTGGLLYLWDGINIIIFVVGLFALSELMMLQASGKTIATAGVARATLRHAVRGALETPRRWGHLLRGSIIGTIIGIIPGTGAAIATFVSYGIGGITAKDKSTYGQGNPEGVIASEVANNAKDGGALLPTLFFGIPGSPEMAILLGAFILFGINPGPEMAFEHMDLVWAIILAVMVSNIIGCAVVIFGAPFLSRITRLPIHLVVAATVPLCLGAMFAARSNGWDYVVLALFAVIGIMIKRAGYPLSPLVIGYVLGPLTEMSFFRTLQAGYYTPEYFFKSTLSFVLIAIVGLLLLAPVAITVWQYVRRRRRVSASQDAAAEKVAGWAARRNSIILGALWAIVAVVIIVGALSYPFEAAIFPMLIGVLLALLLCIVLTADFSSRVASILRVVLGPFGRRGEQRLDVEVRQLIPIMGWLFAFLGVIIVFGMVVASLVFVFVLLVKFGRMNWFKSTLFALAVTAAIYLMFAVAFESPVWPGLIPSLIPRVLGGGVLPPL